MRDSPPHAHEAGRRACLLPSGLRGRRGTRSTECCTYSADWSLPRIRRCTLKSKARSLHDYATRLDRLPYLSSYGSMVASSVKAALKQACANHLRASTNNDCSLFAHGLQYSEGQQKHKQRQHAGKGETLSTEHSSCVDTCAEHAGCRETSLALIGTCPLSRRYDPLRYFF